MRRLLLLAGAVLLALLAAAAAIAIRWRLQDPLAALPREPAASVAPIEERTERWKGRTLVHVVLRGTHVGEVRFVVSLPDPVPASRVPLVVVLGGLRGGSRSIRQISEVTEPGPNALVGYDWPLPHRAPGGLELARRLPELRRAVLSVPGQVDAILGWIAAQAWADPRRVSLLGFSLGAFVAPAAQRLAAERGATIRWTIIAYGGAPIGAVVAGHPGVKPPWAARLMGAAVDLLLRPVEPGEHLPHLRGRFLVLRAATDALIARSAADRITALTPEPREVVVVQGDHMGIGPERQRLLAVVVAIARGWMLAEGAIDVSSPP